MSVITTLRGEPIEVGHEVDVIVPGRKPRNGIYRGFTRGGLIYVELWSPRLGRFTKSRVTYSPKFIHRRKSLLELLDSYASSP